MKKWLAGFILFVVVNLVQAHEFWLQPDKFFYEVGEKALISFKVGENFVGEPWDLKHHRVEKLELHNGTRITDLKKGMEGEKQNIEVTLAQEGTYLFVMQSNSAFSELDAEKFNEYLKVDGLDEVYYHRQKTNTLNSPAKEFYSRHAKLLIQVGGRIDETYKKPVGLPIEIIPERNPYALKKGEMMRFKVLWEGKPLFGARVKVWNRLENRTFLQNIYTEKDGTMEAPISNSGAWMVSVVKMAPSKDKEADWQSYWGSLVFGVK